MTHSSSAEDSRPTVVLWDVDGTLISMGLDAFTAFDRTLERLRPGHVTPDENYNGKTDKYILPSYLKSNGFNEDGIAHIYPFAATLYLKEMAALQKELARLGQRLPGSQEAIDSFSERGIINTVLTGNFPRAAELKLGTFGVRGIDFEVGAYGSDSAERDELVPCALQRIERKYGLTFDTPEKLKSVWIMGDTPLDLRAGRANGLSVGLVATGSSSYENLATLQAEVCVRSLTALPIIHAAMGISDHGRRTPGGPALSLP